MWTRLVLYLHVLFQTRALSLASSSSANVISVLTLSSDITALPSTTSSLEFISQPTSLSLSASVTADSSISTPPASSGASRNATSSSSPTSTSRQPSSSALDDIMTIQSRRLTSIIGALSSPKNIPAWLSTLDSNGKWPDSEVDYTTGCNARRANWPAQSHWQRIIVMSGAWHGGMAGEEEFVKNSTLRAAISRAMDYWFSRDFTNPACLDSGGTPACPCSNPDNSLWNTNWFSNIILIPELVSQVCLLLNGTLVGTQLKNCTHMTGRSYGTFDRNINGVGFLTGANTLDVAKIGIDQALLTYNITLLTDAYRRVHLELQIKNGVKADGIRADGSFGQHAGVLYNGNYGKDYTNDVLDLEIEAGGTEFGAGFDSQEALATLFDGDRWMIFLNSVTGILHWDFSVLGRFISFPVIDAQATGSIKINLTEVLALGQQWSSSSLTSFANTLSIPTGNANAGQLVGNRMFYTNDYMVHRGHNYVTSVKMYSSRTENTECTNLQNPRGFHLSDGTVYTYIVGNEYEDIAAAWDWDLIPGITVDYGATTLACQTTQQTGIENFVGGVSDDSIGIAAMKFTNPLTGSLHWQKAWFFLEDDIQYVMISNISSTTDASVFTVLDQRRHAGTVILNDRENRSRIPADTETLWHGNIGYVFPAFNGTTSVSVRVEERIGNWSTIGTSAQPPTMVDLFTAWIEHNNVSDPVSYTVLPGTSEKAFQKKVKKLSLQELQNDNAISALYDQNNKIAMFVFWEATGGSVTFSPGRNLASITIFVTANIALIYRLDTGEITISDPSQSLIAIQVSLTLGVGQKPKHWGAGITKSMVFQLPTDGLAGSSITQAIN